MAAGLGFKTFTTGEVLTAADTNGYLMQGVLVFASSAARDAAITSPQEGQFAYLKDTNVTTYYTGSAWTNLDTTGMTNPMTTTGDMVYSSSGSTPARLGIGSTAQVLTVASGIPSWATPAAGAVTKISTTSFSGVASQNFEGVFTSTYTFYTVMIDTIFNSGGTGVNLNFTYLYSTNTEQTSQYYGGFYGANQNGTYASISNSNVSAINMGRMNNSSTNSNFYAMSFSGVGNGTFMPTGLVQTYSVGDGPSYGGAIHNEQGRLYTGFKLTPASGNITGTVSIYGWSK